MSERASPPSDAAAARTRPPSGSPSPAVRTPRRRDRLVALSMTFPGAAAPPDLAAAGASLRAVAGELAVRIGGERAY